MKHPTSSLNSTAETTARSATYRLLARLWLREVEAQLLRELQSPPLRDSFLEAGDSPGTQQLADSQYGASLSRS